MKRDAIDIMRSRNKCQNVYPLNFRLTKENKEKLDAICLALGLKRGTVARVLVEDFIKDNEHYIKR